ncbi:MAG: MAPEG family protein [Pseudomonadota bacterium]|nr:MAPEG family protein [Pseudomonadota bacterium]
MDYSPILAPVVALIAWTIIVMFWMVVTRMGEFKRLGINFDNIPPGSRGADLEGRADPRAQWKSHNYSHLVEQPTLFYAIALTLALMNMGDGLNYWLAWGYVGLRVIHSLIQGTVNIVKWRLSVFVLATLCLIGLTLHAALRIANDCGLI